MPLPIALGAAAISGGAALLGGGLSAASTGRQNRKSRRWQEAMYARQRRDNLSDWERINAYNHPAAQRARLEEAGLNPALMYGKTGAFGNAGTVQKTPVGPAQFRPTDFGFVGGAANTAIGNFLQTEMQQAQVSNLVTQNTVLLEEAALKAAQRKNTEANTKRSIFDYAFESELRQVSLDARKENLRQLRAQTYTTLRADQRAQLTNDMSLKEAAERILNYQLGRAKTRAEIDRIYATANNLRKDSQLKEMEIEFARDGISPNDNLFVRFLARKLGPALNSDTGSSLSDKWRGMKNMLQFYNR
jgi:hypothetical protein